uniref:ATP synthase complex subunit 8 n=1 Tax=Plestiodon egregius TaxID=463521 RepID=Q9XPF0_PLEEG|nr:ATP synthase F0 subunit 8 [Plestiodon egregius]AEA37822.1 ATP synthase F0 subunit 8 [Plestiodon egregius]BAA79214.1 ATPase subunit 8 [Plestiodon egregius lividus]
MPQLNPAPWLLILLLSWTVLMFIFKTKTLSSTPHNTPTAPDLLTHHTTPWNWPWT